MGNDEIADLVTIVALTGEPRDLHKNPLNMEEIEDLRHYCRIQLCNGDLGPDYKRFYTQVYDVLTNEFTKGLN